MIAWEIWCFGTSCPSAGLEHLPSRPLAHSGRFFRYGTIFLPARQPVETDLLSALGKSLALIAANRTVCPIQGTLRLRFSWHLVHSLFSTILLRRSALFGLPLRKMSFAPSHRRPPLSLSRVLPASSGGGFRDGPSRTPRAFAAATPSACRWRWAAWRFCFAAARNRSETNPPCFAPLLAQRDWIRSPVPDPAVGLPFHSTFPQDERQPSILLTPGLASFSRQVPWTPQMELHLLGSEQFVYLSPTLPKSRGLTAVHFLFRLLFWKNNRAAKLFLLFYKIFNMWAVSI